MKLRSSLFFVTLTIAFAATENVTALAMETRASHLGGVAVGMGKIMHMADYLKDYPGSRTAIFSYLKLDSEETETLLKTLRTHAAIQEQMRRDFWPQIAIETERLSLLEFRQGLQQRGSLVERNTRMLARELARYRGKNKWFFIRPFSEMNDGTENTPWEFGNKTHPNRPEDLAVAWRLLRDIFDQEGATNALFVFSPLAAYRVHREREVLAALNMIPPGYIDAFGLNVYSRPLTAYGGSSPEPVSFAELTQPWLKLLAQSRHRGIPLAVAEMGVSNQATDEKRAQWLREAFKFVRSRGFVLLTYFNYPHPYWQIDEQTRAGATLRAEINASLLPPTSGPP